MSAQKPNTKMPSVVEELLQRGVDSVGRGFRWAFNLKEGWSEHRDFVQNNYALGLEHLQKGNYADAAFRFKLVTWWRPQNASGWYGLGRAQLAEGKTATAIASLRKAQQLAPKHEETAYMLAVAQGARAEKLPLRMPASLALEHFNSVADIYSQQQAEYGYQAPALIASAVQAGLPAGKLGNSILELGVGSGLVGSAVRPLAARLVGVDFSAAMLSEAGKRLTDGGQPVYDGLIKGDVVAHLKAAPADVFDVVLAAELISYMGDVKELFAEVARVLKAGGVYVFTADSAEGDGYRFLPDAGRFGYGEASLRELARAAGLSVVALEQAAIYPSYKGWLCTLKK